MDSTAIASEATTVLDLQSLEAAAHVERRRDLRRGIGMEHRVLQHAPPLDLPVLAERAVLEHLQEIPIDGPVMPLEQRGEAGWIAVRHPLDELLIRNRLHGKPIFPCAEAVPLLAIQGEVRRIGVNVNQIARALNTAVMEGKVLDLEVAYLDALRTELGGSHRAKASASVKAR